MTLPPVRCDLECGHVGFLLPAEIRQLDRHVFWCHACGGCFVAIVKAEPLEPASRPTARLRRHVARKRTSRS